jgi:cell division inhibitor SulA/protein ImuA
MANALHPLLQHPSLWRGYGSPDARRGVLPTGFPELDARLPSGGWPCPALIELLTTSQGVGELSLLVPALRQLIAAEPVERSRVVAWLNPPYLPYAPGLAQRGLDPTRLVIATPLTRIETLWAMEQALRSGACAAVLGWADRVGGQMLRRLKLAVSEGGSFGVLFRPAQQRRQASPAHLRIALEAGSDELRLELLKVQGSRPGVLRLPMSHLHPDFPRAVS